MDDDGIDAAVDLSTYGCLYLVCWDAADAAACVAFLCGLKDDDNKGDGTNAELIEWDSEDKAGKRRDQAPPLPFI